jgi:TonB-linked SusC/RagA family outer membrane protein
MKYKRKVIYMMVLMFCFHLSLFSQNINLNISNVSVKSAIETLKKNYGYSFIFEAGDVNTQQVISVQAQNQSIDAVIKQIFQGQDVSYEVIAKNIIVRKVASSEVAQQQPQSKKQVTGIVTDTNREPLIGASVSLKGNPTMGTITDNKGYFSLSVPNNAVLQVSYLGYAPQEIAVGNQSQINVTMLEDAKTLSEVVVTALGIKREEKALGYSVQTIKGKELTGIKGAEITTSLTGKVAGLTVFNSTYFASDEEGLYNQLRLRGENALLVVDGFPSSSVNLRDIAADDIETITVLKGPTASALYGSRGSAGAILVTTKRGAGKEGLDVSVNSNTMFNAGYVVLPDRQTTYSTGEGGIYNSYDYVWGDRLDIGHTAVQYNPYTYEYEMAPLTSKGKDNFKNFMQQGFVTNNNVSVTHTGKTGSFRSSLTHVNQRGVFPNETSNKFNLNVAGDIHYDKFSLDASVNYTKQVISSGQNQGWSHTNPMYNLLAWQGAEFDVRDFKDYWKAGKEGVEQNYHDAYYNNPYWEQYEWVKPIDEGRYTAQLNSSYQITDWLKAVARVGSDQYTRNKEEKQPESYKQRQAWNYRRGKYSIQKYNGYSVNVDGMLMADKKFGDWGVDGFFGGSIYYNNYGELKAETKGSGLTSFNYYSLKAGANGVDVSSNTWEEQRNSLFGKVGFAWKSTAFVDVTGRNDWTSTLAAGERSYFYPSIAGSLVLSELIPTIEWLSFWKVRASWTQTKLPTGIYEINQAYSITNDVWGSEKGAYYPSTIRSGGLKPRTNEGIEYGTGINVLDNRLRLDLTYFSKRYYNNQAYAPLTDATGYSSAQVNTDEELMRRGWEISLSGDIIKRKDLTWTAIANWSNNKYTFHQLDEIYSAKDYWVAVGKRADMLSIGNYETHPVTGELILQNGLPVNAVQPSIYHETPDWAWGFNNELTYKDFTLNFSFDGRVGGLMNDRMAGAMWVNGTHPDSDNPYRYDEVVNGNHAGYIAPGLKIISGEVTYNADRSIATDTRVYAPNDVPVSYETYIRKTGRDHFQHFRDRTFAKLRELSIGYTVPKYLTKKAKLDNVQISLVGQNLWIWMKDFKMTDPDNNDTGNLPAPSERLIGFNVKLNF